MAMSLEKGNGNARKWFKVLGKESWENIFCRWRSSKVSLFNSGGHFVFWVKDKSGPPTGRFIEYFKKKRGWLVFIVMHTSPRITCLFRQCLPPKGSEATVPVQLQMICLIILLSASIIRFFWFTGNGHHRRTTISDWDCKRRGVGQPSSVSEESEGNRLLVGL